MRPISVRAIWIALCLAVAWPAVVSAQTNSYIANGTEYAVVGSMPGDQIFPDAAISPTGGFVVWQDSFSDTNGLGISARRVDSTLSGSLGTFTVNVAASGNQENPRVRLLNGGGAVFVWQGGQPGYQHIYARFMTASNTFVPAAADLMVSTPANRYQKNPAAAVLTNGNVVVVWSSLNQAGTNTMEDIYGQILSPAGGKVGGEFLINQATPSNQRCPSVAALSGGGFVVTWVTETVQSTPTNQVNYGGAQPVRVDVNARMFADTGAAAGNEFRVNTDANLCISPVVAAAANGSFMVAWTARDGANQSNSMDVCGRIFSGGGVGGGVFYVNEHLYGDQYLPKISAGGTDFMVVWTSLGQDGSREGVFGRFVGVDGSMLSGEIRVNHNTVGQQLQPAVAGDGAGQFLVTWTTFNGFPNTFDLASQRFINTASVLSPMAAPFVWAPFVVSNGLYQPRLVVSWAPIQGMMVSNYLVYVDGSETPMATVSGGMNQWTMTAAHGLTAGSTHSFQVDYVLADGRRPGAHSSATAGATWMGLNWGGIPFEWMTQYYGSDISQWPTASSKIGSGPTVYQVFLSGGNPLDPKTWLRTTLTRSSQGMLLSWNTQPGAIYQVQVTQDLKTWSNVGGPRFAADLADSIFVGNNPRSYYRVVLQR